MSEATNAELQELVVRQQRELSALRQATEQAAVKGAIASALAGVELVSPAAGAHLTEFLSKDAVVHNEGGRITITGPGFTPLADHVKEQLARPEFSHFLRSPGSPSRQSAPPALRGQGGLPGGVDAYGRPLAPYGHGADGAPLSLSEVVIGAALQQRQAEGDPRTNPNIAFGLHRVAPK